MGADPHRRKCLQIGIMLSGATKKQGFSHTSWFSCGNPLLLLLETAGTLCTWLRTFRPVRSPLLGYVKAAKIARIVQNRDTCRSHSSYSHSVFHDETGCKTGGSLVLPFDQLMSLRSLRWTRDKLKLRLWSHSNLLIIALPQKGLGSRATPEVLPALPPSDFKSHSVYTEMRRR